MQDTQLRRMIDEVKDGRMDRRAFIQRMIGLGLTAPMATQLLAIGGVAMAQSPSPYKPTKRGGGGPLKLLWWQGPTLLNPHFATGTKDQDGSRIFYEPFASWDVEGNLNPILAAEIPSIQNGGLSADGKSVTWKLKPGVKWHDGKPFTADDLVFTLDYANDLATAAVSIAVYRDIKVEKVDDHTVRVLFNRPTPFWANAFVGGYGCIIPKHLFADYKGAKSREAPSNLAPVGTGPYKFVEFKPGDLVRGEINPDYHMPNRPYFDTVEMKGGGDAVSAARAVIQTGEYDYAWNMQVEDEVLLRLEKGGKGKTIYAPGGDIELIALNSTDPNTEVDGERSSMKTKHPLFCDPAVRKALALLVDREAVEKAHLRPRRRRHRQLPQRPGALRLQEHHMGIQRRQGEQAARRGRLEAGRGRHPRQGRQAAEAAVPDLDQRAAPEEPGDRQAGLPEGRHRDRAEIGRGLGVFLLRCRPIPTPMPNSIADIADVHDDDDAARSRRGSCASSSSCEIATKANKWQGRNFTRWHKADYDAAFDAAESELDPVKRAALYIKMNDLVVGRTRPSSPHVPPRGRRMSQQAAGASERLGQRLWNLRDWYRET